jgi:MFS family permease
MELFRGNLWKISISRMLAMGAERLVWPFFSLFILELGGSVSSIALVSMVGSLAAVLISPIGGYVADSSGRVKLLGFGTLCYSLCSIFFIFAQDWRLLVFLVFFQMLFRFYMPALDAILADSIKMEERGKGYAFSDSIAAIPSIIAPIIIGIIADRFSVKFAVRIGFLGLLVFGSIAALIRFTLEETVSKKKSINLREFPNLIKESYQAIFSLFRGEFGVLKVIIIVSFLFTILNSTVGPYWNVYAINEIGLSASQWGVITAAGSVMRALLLFPAGLLSDRFGPKKLILLSLLPLPICSIFFIKSTSFISTFLIFIVMYFSNILLSPSSSSIFLRATAKSKRGTVVSAIGRGRFGIVVGSGFLAGGLLLFPARLIGFRLGDILYQINKTYPWIFLTIGTILITVFIFRFLYEKL